MPLEDQKGLNEKFDQAAVKAPKGLGYEASERQVENYARTVDDPERRAELLEKAKALKTRNDERKATYQARQNNFDLARRQGYHPGKTRADFIDNDIKIENARRDRAVAKAKVDYNKEGGLPKKFEAAKKRVSAAERFNSSNKIPYENRPLINIPRPRQ